jgi:hypothetical protein
LGPAAAAGPAALAALAALAKRSGEPPAPGVGSRVAPVIDQKISRRATLHKHFMKKKKKKKKKNE